MTANVSEFDRFLASIRPSSNQIEDFVEAHTTLRRRFHEDETVKAIHLGDFLQGSYRRYTAIRPVEGRKSDVDIVVVTNLEKDTTNVSDLKEQFVTFLESFDDYRGSIDTSKAHAIGLSVGEVEMDLVIALTPSPANLESIRIEFDVTTKATATGSDFWGSMVSGPHFAGRDANNENWKLEPLLIPNFHVDDWDESDPLTQIRWTQEHNQKCGGHFVNVIKAVKWWKREMAPNPKHPKSFPLEHLVGDYCAPGIGSVAEGVSTTFEAIANCPTLNRHLQQGTIPQFSDRGIHTKDVWHRICFEDFEGFMDQVAVASTLAKSAYIELDSANSACLWGSLFGPSFPTPDDCSSREISRGGFARPGSVARPSRGTFGKGTN